jgi:hypothetical protein
VRKRVFLRHLYIKCIILPRQARDKHREISKKGRRFLAGGTICPASYKAEGGRCPVMEWEEQVRNAIFVPFIH